MKAPREQDGGAPASSARALTAVTPDRVIRSVDDLSDDAVEELAHVFVDGMRGRPPAAHWAPWTGVAVAGLLLPLIGTFFLETKVSIFVSLVAGVSTSIGAAVGAVTFTRNRTLRGIAAVKAHLRSLGIAHAVRRAAAARLGSLTPACSVDDAIGRLKPGVHRDSAGEAVRLRLEDLSPQTLRAIVTPEVVQRRLARWVGMAPAMVFLISHPGHLGGILLYLLLLVVAVVVRAKVRPRSLRLFDLPLHAGEIERLADLLTKALRQTRKARLLRRHEDGVELVMEHLRGLLGPPAESALAAAREESLGDVRSDIALTTTVPMTSRNDESSRREAVATVAESATVRRS